MRLNKSQIGVLLMCVILATIIILGAGHYLEKPSINELTDSQLRSELVSIKGIGAVTADRVVKYRAENKPVSMAELDSIKGIGDKRLALIKKKFKE